ncbi:hypothetical protein BBO99_00007712 [Phytophthora kernoviae]|uniref:Protein kinase domain-containing protein n=1 Tax=Phytophthora kernoviae TaxID=325452 RepID=A0A3R7JQK4_9STRA|nr:hypothetical protein JM16_008076 [Phytophthora kernoviae]RLM95395.1 hypothetical protein BBI17_008261 [Phytophthora kernoviae]RLN76247.1 hypothetical protein BBO99_00007712 [Phytophthora kernoviae]
MLRGMFVSRKHPEALVNLDIFYFLDGAGWALVELETNELAATFRRMLDHRPLGMKTLRVYQAGQKEINNFNHQKGKLQMMRLQGATDRVLPSPAMSPEEKENEQPEVPDQKMPYYFGRKLNWIVTEEELKELSVQQVLSSSLEESLRVKYVKSIFHIAKGLRLDREDATSAIIALNRYFTFNAMPMDVEIYAATMLNLFLKAHARKVSWAAYIKEVYKAKHGAVAVERLTTDSPELAALKRHVVKTEGELLEGLRYDVTGEDVYALLDLLTTRKSPKKIVGMSHSGSTQPFLSSLPPVEVQKEAKHLVSESLRLPIWTRNPVECVMLSIVYVSAAVIEVLRSEPSTSMTAIPDFLPQMDLQANYDEAKMLLGCSLLICTRLKDRWTRLENQSKAAQQKKAKSTDSEFDLEQFDVSRAKDVDISERIARVALTPELRKKAIFDMLQSLAAVHDLGYVHRFVALSHLLVFQHGIKLGGYHAMRKIAALKPKEGEVIWTAAYDMSDAERKAHCYGSWLHVSAPEVLLGETKYTWRADVWSAGCVALAILLEKVPFLQGQDAKIQLDLIYRLCGTPNSTWEGACKLPQYSIFRPKHEYKMRLRKTLLEQRTKFPDFPEDAVEVLESMLQLDPSKRSTIKKLLEMRYFDSIRSGGQLVDFSGLSPTFPVQKKKLVQHLIKSKAKKRRISASGRSSSSAGSSHHHRSSHGHGSSEHHRRKRSLSSAHEDSVSRGDKRHHHDHRRPKSDKHKSRSLPTARREDKVPNSTEDVEMQDTSEYVPLPESFVSSSAISSALVSDNSLPPREKREKLGWGMGLNSG